jgi:hypothetical protein
MKKGKCSKCMILFTWNSTTLLRHACCPICQKPLERTTYLLQGYNHSHREPVTSLKP